MKKHFLLSCLIAAVCCFVTTPAHSQETLTGPMPIANPVAIDVREPDDSANTAVVVADTVAYDIGAAASEPVAQASAAPSGDPGYSVPESFYESQSPGGSSAPAASQASPAMTGESNTKKHKGWHVKSRASSSSSSTKSEPAPTAESTPSVSEPAPMEASSAPAPAPEPVPVVAEAAPQPTPEPVPNYSTPAAPAPTPAPEAAASADVAGYDGGFFLKSRDGKYSWALNGRIQPRFAANIAEDIEDKYSFTVRRVLLVMSGTVVDPKLTYEIVMMPAVTPILVGAALGYAFMPEFNMSVGYQTIPTAHTALESSGKFQLVDSSLPTLKFNVGDSVGLLFSGTIGKFYYASGVFNGAATDLARNQNNEMAYGLQLVYNVVGAYGSHESDLKDSQEPNWVIDLSGNYHHEESGTQAKVIHGAAFTGLKWHGLGLLLEGNIRYTDPDEFTREQVDLGYTMQAGYFVIPTKLEIAARHSALLDDVNDIGINQNMTAGNIGGLDGPHIGVDVGGDSDNEYEFSGAISYYFVGNSIKLQAQYSYILDGIPGPDDETYHVGIIQGQVGF